MNPSVILPDTSSGGQDFKALYRKLEHTLDEIEEMESTADLLSTILRSLVEDYEEDLGFRGGRLYVRDAAGLTLCCVAGDRGDAPDSYRIPLGYPPVQTLLSDGLIILKHGDPGFDEAIEKPIGVNQFVAIAIGEEDSHVMSFTIDGKIRELELLYSLNAVKHSINLRLRQNRLRLTMQEARYIQEGLLPEGPPEFEGYEIDGLSRPTEFVGGDLFDYLPLAPTLLGVAVADASGHGLPAALLARDVITGLRIGMAADFKIAYTIAKLNSVIHRSALSSKFASLFYGELEPNGNFIYTNAGQTPPLLYHREKDQFLELRQGGLVLGPSPDAQYERGYVRLYSGDRVILYTDGITEYENPDGEQFGEERLREAIRSRADATASEMVHSIFDAVSRFAARAPQRDDMTVVAIRKL